MNKRLPTAGLILLIILVFVLFGKLAGPPERDAGALQNAVPGPRCNPTGADKIIASAGSAIIHRIDRRSSTPLIYVKAAWHDLTFDEKQTFDGILQCSLTRGIGESLIISYHDYKTGKEIAESNRYGFRIP